MPLVEITQLSRQAFRRVHHVCVIDRHWSSGLGICHLKRLEIWISRTLVKLMEDDDSFLHLAYSNSWIQFQGLRPQYTLLRVLLAWPLWGMPSSLNSRFRHVIEKTALVELIWLPYSYLKLSLWSLQFIRLVAQTLLLINLFYWCDIFKCWTSVDLTGKCWVFILPLFLKRFSHFTSFPK